jgi:hypothetical protein
VVLLATVALLGADWPSNGADPAHGRLNRESAVAREDRAAFSTLFTAPTGGLIDASPAIANGFVYVTSADQKLSAFDAHGATGCSSGVVVCAPL